MKRFQPVFLCRQFFLLVAILILFLPSCLIHVHPVPPQMNSVFTFSNVFSGCNSTLSGSTIITYKATFIVYYINGNDKKQLFFKDVTSAPTNPSPSFTITALIPSDATEWEWELTLEGTQCSICALTDYPNDPCPQNNVIQNNVVIGKSAAKPRRYGITMPIGTHLASYSVDCRALPGIQNVANSCNCTVPN